VAPRRRARLGRPAAGRPRQRADGFFPVLLGDHFAARLRTLASTWHGYIRDGKPVLPIQEDETALVIWALWQAFQQYQRIEETAPFYRALVTVPADFMLQYVDHATGLPLPSHDPWEERWGVHAFTVGAVIAGLRAAANVSEAFGEDDRAVRYRDGATRMVAGLRRVLWSPKHGRFARMAAPGPDGYTLDMTIDASVFGLVEFGALEPDDPQAMATMAQVEERLLVRTAIGGMARYENDDYQAVEQRDRTKVPGNPWFIATMWLARYRLQLAKTPADMARGLELIVWAADRALPSGVMAEQINPYNGEPLSVSPLTWSHAAYVTAVREYVDRMTTLTTCPSCGQPVRKGPRLSEQFRPAATP
jgi:GH15 family glucan-1,4-alpha-glucosidase